MLEQIVQKVKEEMCVGDCTKSKGRNVCSRLYKK